MTSLSLSQALLLNMHTHMANLTLSLTLTLMPKRQFLVLLLFLTTGHCMLNRPLPTGHQLLQVGQLTPAALAPCLTILLLAVGGIHHLETLVSTFPRHLLLHKERHPTLHPSEPLVRGKFEPLDQQAFNQNLLMSPNLHQYSIRQTPSHMIQPHNMYTITPLLIQNSPHHKVLQISKLRATQQVIRMAQKNSCILANSPVRCILSLTVLMITVDSRKNYRI